MTTNNRTDKMHKKLKAFDFLIIISLLYLGVFHPYAAMTKPLMR
jgi:hypothetical protein